jgi:hypothetical protein
MTLQGAERLREQQSFIEGRSRYLKQIIHVIDDEIVAVKYI